MPSSNRLPLDLDSSTVVPSTPFERLDVAPAVATPVEGGSSMDTHFNASLDKALLLLRHKEREERAGSSTPMSWSSSATLGGKNSYRDGWSPVSDTAKTEAPVRAECQVRARIPYPGGHFYLHLFHTDEDDKEHLALVFGDDIRSETLERARADESDVDRRIRGASTGALRRMVGREIARRHQGAQETAKEDAGFFEPDAADAFAAPRVSIVEAPLVRVHSECFTGETVSSVRCDCGPQLAEAMREIQNEGRGVIVYLRQEGRGIGLLEKLKAYNLQDQGHDTVDANLLLNHPADARTYGAARAILADLGVARLRLLTNNKDKIRQLSTADPRAPQLDVVCHVPMLPRWWDAQSIGTTGVMAEADRYLRTKAERMGHMLPMNAPLALPGIIKPHVSAAATSWCLQ
ncbi:GTP cyclohydrolase II [Coemansia sp. RSA 1933]|nr:GTP cyclohydrolase II [Coemansia sp. RSA 1933]